MEYIALTQNKRTIIDNKDFKKVSKYKWCYKISKILKDGREYGVAVHGFWNSKRQQNKIIKLHRFILGLTDPKIIVDHINGNTLDNRKSNLRIVDGTLNNMNRRGVKGCQWDRRTGQWRAELGFYGKRIWLGRFNRKEDAIKVYKLAVIKYYGEPREFMV